MDRKRLGLVVSYQILARQLLKLCNPERGKKAPERLLSVVPVSWELTNSFLCMCTHTGEKRGKVKASACPCPWVWNSTFPLCLSLVQTTVGLKTSVLVGAKPRACHKPRAPPGSPP